MRKRSVCHITPYRTVSVEAEETHKRQLAFRTAENMAWWQVFNSGRVNMNNGIFDKVILSQVPNICGQSSSTMAKKTNKKTKKQQPITFWHLKIPYLKFLALGGAPLAQLVEHLQICKNTVSQNSFTQSHPSSLSRPISCQPTVYYQ